MNDDDKKQAAKDRVKAYRKRLRDHQTGGNDGGERSFSTVLPVQTLFALDRLAKRNKVTKKDMLSRLIMTADDAVIAGLNDDDLDEYLR